MIFKKSYFESNNLKALFTSIIIMFLPFFISFTLLETTNYLLPLVAFAYILQTIIISSSYLKDKVYYKVIIFTIILMVIQLITVASNSLLGINTNYNDYINLTAKTVNYFLLFGIMLNIKTTKENIIYFMKYMIIFAIIACLYNIVKNWTLILNLTNITSSYQVDLKSFFPNRNQFGMFLFIAIVANNYRTLVSKKNSAYYMVNFLLIMNLMMTMSRGAILAVLIFYIILYIKQLKSKKTLISLIIILSTVITVIFSNSQLRDFIVRNVVRADAGVAGRLDVWKMGVNVYSKSNLLSGVGFHTGIDIAKAAGFRFDQFHNFFIDILVSGGLIELMFMVITILYVYRRVMIKCWDRNYKRIYKASMGAIIALGLVESVSFFSIGFVDTIYTIFFITIPILASSMMPPKDLGVAGVEINDNLKGGQNEEKYDRV